MTGMTMLDQSLLELQTELRLSRYFWKKDRHNFCFAVILPRMRYSFHTQNEGHDVRPKGVFLIYGGEHPDTSGIKPAYVWISRHFAEANVYFPYPYPRSYLSHQKSVDWAMLYTLKMLLCDVLVGSTT